MMSFEEKSTWVSLGATLLTFGGYFAVVFRVLANEGAVAAVLIPLFIGTVVQLVIIQVFLQTILAIVFHRQADEGTDERDYLIELKATRISYFVLVFGVFATGTSVLLDVPPLMMANIILFFFILAEVIGYSIQLFYYRRGV